MTPSTVVALLTPFNSSGGIDAGAVAAHVAWLLEAGVDALMPAGTTGECALLEPDEVHELIRCTVRAANGRARVLAHVGRPATDATVRLARRAFDAGADHVSAVVPYYYKYSDDEIERHYRALMEAVGPERVYAYTIPERTSNVLDPAVVQALARDGLGGVKDSTKSIEQHRAYLACGAPVLMGSDALVLEAYRMGAAGVVSAVSNVRPDLLVALARRFTHDDAAALQAEVVQIRSATKTTAPLAELKRQVAQSVPGYPTAMRGPLS